MTQIPAGWYPDPDPDAPEPRGQRWWDGRMWTEHVQPPPGMPAYPPAPGYGSPSGRPEQSDEPGPYGEPGRADPYAQQPGSGASGQPGPYAQPGPYSQYGQQPGPYAQQPGPPGQFGYPAAPYAGGAGRPATTPDGQPLASWWSRVGAYVLDLLILTPVILLLASPWMGDLFRAFGDYIDEATRAAESGQTPPDQAALMRDIAGPMLAVTIVSLLVNFVYNVGFLKWKAATPGKLVVGLRVRLRETPGPLGWGTIVKRWLGQFGYQLLSAVPIIGSFTPLYFFVDSLWPLWDTKKQALHDKIAATNVVRVR